MPRRPLIDADLRAGLAIGLVVGLAWVAALLWGYVPLGGAAPAALPVHRAPAVSPADADFGREEASADVRLLADWIIETHDNGERDFVLVDKRNAKLFVFEARGRLAGATPVLLGFAVGDDTAPGVASKPLSQILPAERTTPAGRFLSQAGLNAAQEEVIWVDYDAAVSMHRLRPMHARERRLERLASPTSADNRISSGCINVPVEFFEQILWPRLRLGRQGVVYVLPETRPLSTAFAVPVRDGD